MVRSILRISVVLSIAVWALTARPVSAQITTGTLSGSVKDAQGAVVPGATVTLVSAVRGTTTDTQTSTDGDFVFPNVTAGTYLVRVTMDGFKTLERPGVVVSPGDRALLQTLTIEVGTLAETVTVQADTPIVQASSGERSFTIPDASRSRTCRSPTAASPASPRSRRASPQAPTRPHRRRRPEQHHDGRHLDDGHRQQRDPAADERRVDRGSQSPHLELPGRIRTIERAADHGRDQERHEPVPRLGLRRVPGLRLELQQPDERPQRRPQDGAGGKGSRATRSAARSASRAATTSCSSSTATNTRRGPAATTSCATGCRRRSNGPAISRSPTTTTARCSRYIKDPLLSGACSATNQAGCFNDGGVLGRIPANRLYQTGINLLNLYPLPNINGAGLGLQLRNHPARRRRRSRMQPAIRVDYQPTQTLRATASTRASGSATRCSTARCPASTTRSSRTRSSARWR